MDHETLKLIIEVIVTIVAIVCTRYLVPWLKKSVDEKTLKTVLTWVEEAVNAADQIMSAEQTEEKKKYVLDFLDKLLQDNNITISAEDIDIMVEAAVKQIRLKEKSKS